LEKVSVPKRMAFMLWAVEGMPVEQVAEAMQASVSATRSRIFYAQKAIKASAARDPYLRRWLDGGEGQ
jgi:DNA-directed RNA polymerase specialized sigma24 family protein